MVREIPKRLDGAFLTNQRGFFVFMAVGTSLVGLFELAAVAALNQGRTPELDSRAALALTGGRNASFW